MTGGALDASVTLDEALEVVASKRVPLAPELAGYLALEIAENADPNGGEVDPKNVFIGEDGTVAILKPKRERANGDAETSVRTALGRLLDAGGAQTPALAAASKRSNGGGLAALAGELHAALIPVNRAAGRRALARLVREVKRITLGVGRHTLSSALPPGDVSARRPSTSGFSKEEDPTTVRSRIPYDVATRAPATDRSELPTTQFSLDTRAQSPSEADVDSLIEKFGASGGSEQQQARALKAIAGLDPTPAAPAEMARRIVHDASSPTGGAQQSPQHKPLAGLTRDESTVEALLGMNWAGHPSGVTRPSSPGALREPLPMTRPASASAGAVSSSERQLPTQPSEFKKTRPAQPNATMAPPKRGAGLLVVLALVAIAAGSYAVWQLRPDLTGGGPASPTASTLQAPEVQPDCIGTLLVSDVPPRAEVLVHQGQAPVDIARMPVGARLEFVATAEGYAPKRVVVPEGAPWDPGPDGKPRFEAAVQLDPSHARAGDSWPSGEPGSAVGGDGPPGTVRVVATPRGAEVWMLSGIAPEARIEHLRCDRDFDVLLAGPTTYRKRVHIGSSDFVPDGAPGTAGAAARVARVSGK